MKKFTERSRLEHESIHYVAYETYRGRHIFRGSSSPDIGIDGEIEFMKLDEKQQPYVSSFIFAKIQLKAHTDSFTFSAKAGNFHDWLRISTPVLAIIYNAQQQKAIWFDLLLFSKRSALLQANEQGKYSITLPFNDRTEFSATTLPNILQYLEQQYATQHTHISLSVPQTHNNNKDYNDDSESPIKCAVSTPTYVDIDTSIESWIDELVNGDLDDLCDYSESHDDQKRVYARLNKQFNIIPASIVKYWSLFSSINKQQLRNKLNGVSDAWQNMAFYAANVVNSCDLVSWVIGASPKLCCSMAESVRNDPESYGNPNYTSIPIPELYYSQDDEINRGRAYRDRGDSVTELSVPEPLERYLQDISFGL